MISPQTPSFSAIIQPLSDNSQFDSCSRIESGSWSQRRELTLNKNQIENYQKEVELWQKRLEFEEKSLSLRIKRVEIREKQVKDRIKAVMERQRMVGEKEKESKAVSEAMDCSEKILKEFVNNLELKGGELSKLFLVLEKEKKVLELRKEELYNVVDLKENKMKKAMEIKEQEISKLREALSVLSKKMMLKEKQMNEYYQREKRSDGNLMLCRCRDQESIKKQNVDSSSSKIGHDIHSLCKHMDADGVRSYLIKHFKEQSILQEKVLDAIRFAPNPGKLVLDVCQSFHQKYSDKGELVKNQSSCTFLLEQFRKLSAPIRHDVEDDAIYFADSMKDWLKGYTTPADIFEFLQFLAAFKLAGRYNADELLSLLGCLWG
ncbi:hypothetical protein BVRB_4g083070 [Beta vulgaris subsp. vulgaris]|nr:hypothetical protein BVRB_4g083070 [Beta vulgaris subsp. vulgaris]